MFRYSFALAALSVAAGFAAWLGRLRRRPAVQDLINPSHLDALQDTIVVG